MNIKAYNTLLYANVLPDLLMASFFRYKYTNFRV